MEWSLPGDLIPKDIMHIVSRSHMGLGVEENGVLGCRYHHNLMDNGNKGLGKEMVSMLEEYMSSFTRDGAGKVLHIRNTVETPGVSRKNLYLLMGETYITRASLLADGSGRSHGRPKPPQRRAMWKL